MRGRKIRCRIQGANHSRAARSISRLTSSDRPKSPSLRRRLSGGIGPRRRVDPLGAAHSAAASKLGAGDADFLWFVSVAGPRPTASRAAGGSLTRSRAGSFSVSSRSRARAGPFPLAAVRHRHWLPAPRRGHATRRSFPRGASARRAHTRRSCRSFADATRHACRPSTRPRPCAACERPVQSSAQSGPNPKPTSQALQIKMNVSTP